MKISLAWVLDHIATVVKHVDVEEIVARFNTRTAEIEHYDEVKTDVTSLYIARVTDIGDSLVTLFCPELKESIIMPSRVDARIGDLFLLQKHKKTFVWSCVQDFNSAKEGFFPAVDCKESELDGSWKKQVEQHDYILDVDNKSINHRPDLWGHRGIAREIAAFMGWKLKPIESMLASVQQVDFDIKSKKATALQPHIAIEDLKGCSRFAALYCQTAVHKGSQIWMAIRLARVDSRPINTIVDITNYVMFDISQPMHVFDAANFPDKNLVIRRAKAKEKLELLDDQTVTLTSDDVVVTDGKHPVALAGVMGGRQASFSTQATSLLIESASFHATMVRESAIRLKVQTEASARFSKNLDPMQNVIALARFMKLGYQAHVVEKVDGSIVSVGRVYNPLSIQVAHDFIEKKLGMQIPSKQVIAMLQSLDFHVKVKELKQGFVYLVTVPTYRTTKDIGIAEDIVEEVGRLYGYEKIAYNLPMRQMSSFDMTKVQTLRAIKQHCAFAMQMHEIRDYAFYDESFIQRLKWQPEHAVAVKNPVSENWKVLVTSLVPHLLKNVELNSHQVEAMRFFECNSVWREISKKEAQEHTSLAGIFFGQQKLDFYACKAELEKFFHMLEISVEWKKSSKKIEPWFEAVQTADLICGKEYIGRAGMLSKHFVRPLLAGHGFVFECNVSTLLAQVGGKKQFVPWSKYQDVSLDISMLVHVQVEADTLKSAVMHADKKIDKVELVDFFEKEEWVDKRSITLRYRIAARQETLTKQEIDIVVDHVQKAVKKLGAEVR